MERINNNFTSIQQLTDTYLNQDKKSVDKFNTKPTVSFEEILKQKSEVADTNTELKFSKHATKRLQDRNISLSAEQNARLENGVEKANEKGIKDSLVLVDSLAFIVNVPNKTVVTTIDQNEASEKIFTNIDGAVII